jgi:hypothetical protein
MGILMKVGLIVAFTLLAILLIGRVALSFAIKSFYDNYDS